MTCGVTPPSVTNARGYRVDKKRITIAYAAECVIIAASLYGAWLFAATYGHNDSDHRR